MRSESSLFAAILFGAICIFFVDGRTSVAGTKTQIPIPKITKAPPIAFFKLADVGDNCVLKNGVNVFVGKSITKAKELCRIAAQTSKCDCEGAKIVTVRGPYAVDDRTASLDAADRADFVYRGSDGEIYNKNGSPWGP